MFWLGAIVSLCYVPGVTGAFIATQWPVLAVAMSAALLWRRGPFTLYHGLGLLFLAYATAHLLFTPVPYASVFGWWLIVIMGMCVWFGTTMETGGTELRDLYRGLALGGAISSVVAMFQWLGYDRVPVVSGLPAGIYTNSIQQGTVLALLVVALISERLWLWVPFMLPGIILSGSRGAWIALAVGLLAFGVRRAWLLGAVGVAGAFYLLGPLSPSDVQRMVIWDAAWHNLTWLGWGPGIFYTVLLPQGSQMFYPEHAHNDALQLAFEYGIGAVPAYAIFAFALSRTRTREWPLVVAFVAAGCYSMPLWMPIASFLALVAVGRILRTSVDVSDDSDNRGRQVVPWRRTAGSQSVPLASYHTAEG